MKTCFPPLIVVALCAFLQVAETHAQAPAPNQTFNITLADAPVSVERWGTGPTAIIFFGFWPFDIQENLKADFGSEFAALVGSKYSMFLWTYPEQVAPYSHAIDALGHYYDWIYGGMPEHEDPFAKRPNFAGQATSVVNQIRAATGLTDVCLVGNSFGAGVILWDLENLAKNPSTRFVLISPTEVFMPPVPPKANPLPRTVLVADAKLDELVLTETAQDYLIDRTTGPLPPGYEPPDSPHFVIGDSLTPLGFVFSLVNLAPSISSITSASGAVDKAFSYRIVANNSPSRYGATGLPDGLTLDSQTGVISGKPRRAGTFRVEISATNGSGMGNASLSIVVAKGTQTIRFTPDKTRRFREGGTFTLSATATSGLPITSFTSSKPKRLSIQGTKATMRGKGSVTVTAHQKGNANYRSAKLSKTIVIK